MKKLFDYANKYASQSTWKEFAMVKLCLCAMGIIIGILIPASVKFPVLLIALLLFAVTYIPLMIGFFKVIKREK